VGNCPCSTRKANVTYRLTTPWEWETWITADNQDSPYSRLAGRPITGGTSTGAINPFLTDIPRGVTLLVNGTTVTATRYPYQDDIADADAVYMGGHTYEIDDQAAQILIDAGYSQYLENI
jgi:hypothetical protein